LAYLKTGDVIDIDIPKRKISVRLTAAEISKRKKTMKLLAPKERSGYLARYARSVTSASTGAVHR
jgi:dihydroxy-acid dehydratase